MLEQNEVVDLGYVLLQVERCEFLLRVEETPIRLHDFAIDYPDFSRGREVCVDCFGVVILCFLSAGNLHAQSGERIGHGPGGLRVLRERIEQGIDHALRRIEQKIEPLRVLVEVIASENGSSERSLHRPDFLLGFVPDRHAFRTVTPEEFL